jgi:hypothetical protein
MKTHGGALHLIEVSGQFTLRPLYPREKCPQYPFNKTDWMDPRAGADAVRSGEKSLAPFGNRTPVVQAEAESLCQLNYPGSLYVISIKIKVLPTEAIFDGT